MAKQKLSRADNSAFVEGIFGAMGSGKTAYATYRAIERSKAVNGTPIVFSPDNRLPRRLPSGEKVQFKDCPTIDDLVDAMQWSRITGSQKILVYSGEDWRDFQAAVVIESRKRETSIFGDRALVITLDESWCVPGMSGSRNRDATSFMRWITGARHLNMLVSFCSQSPSAAGNHVLAQCTAFTFFYVRGRDYYDYFRDRFDIEFNPKPSEYKQFECKHFVYLDCPEHLMQPYPYNNSNPLESVIYASRNIYPGD